MDPGLLMPQVVDAERLQPAYDVVAKKVLTILFNYLECSEIEFNWQHEQDTISSRLSEYMLKTRV